MGRLRPGRRPPRRGLPSVISSTGRLGSCCATVIRHVAAIHALWRPSQRSLPLAGTKARIGRRSSVRTDPFDGDLQKVARSSAMRRLFPARPPKASGQRHAWRRGSARIERRRSSPERVPGRDMRIAPVGSSEIGGRDGRGWDCVVLMMSLCPQSMCLRADAWHERWFSYVAAQPIVRARYKPRKVHGHRRSGEPHLRPAVSRNLNITGVCWQRGK